MRYKRGRRFTANTKTARSFEMFDFLPFRTHLIEPNNPINNKMCLVSELKIDKTATLLIRYISEYR